MSHKVRIAPSTRKRSKMIASEVRATINKVTEKTLKMSKLGKGLKQFNNLAELFDDLGI